YLPRGAGDPGIARAREDRGARADDRGEGGARQVRRRGAEGDRGPRAHARRALTLREALSRRVTAPPPGGTLPVYVKTLPKSVLRFASFSLASAILAAPPAHAGAWTQPPGSLYARLTYAGINSQTRFDADGECRSLEPRFAFAARDGATEYRAREARVYAEYGLVERFTTYGSLTYKSVVMEEPVVKSTNSGFGDLMLGGRYRVLGGR